MLCTGFSTEITKADIVGLGRKRPLLTFFLLITFIHGDTFQMSNHFPTPGLFPESFSSADQRRMTYMKSALIIEDDQLIRGFIESCLRKNGWQVDMASDGIEGLHKAESKRHQIVVLDLIMPRLDGIGFLIQFREWSSTPVIIVSAKTELRDKISLLRMGADDYLTKPFQGTELIARIDAILRRSNSNLDDSGGIFTSGQLKIDFEVRQATLVGNDLKLNPHEFEILKLLAIHTGKVIESNTLLGKVWKNDQAGSHDLQVAISSLKQKLGSGKDHIVNVHGVGYKFIDMT